jgi:hypothetical protein
MEKVFGYLPRSVYFILLIFISFVFSNKDEIDFFHERRKISDRFSRSRDRVAKRVGATDFVS